MVPAIAHGALLLLLASPFAQGESLLGFPDAREQLEREAEYRAALSAEDQQSWSKTLTAQPHHAGSEHGRFNAEFIAERFRDWGYDVEVEVFDILLPVPLKRHLSLESPTRYTAVLMEDVVAGDVSTEDRDEVLPPYNAFSIDGDVTGELVFVNYGIPEDYELLERYGINVTGKIVIAKYGKSWRGIKPKLAAEKGAIGTIIYSDPADDGFSRGDVYPEGAFKNASGVQRGSVMDMPLYPGDVLTPGKPAIKGTRRLSRNKAPTITRIPVLPISYKDAQPLLRALGGEVVPLEWQGALPLTYHLGPGPARVRLALEFDWQRISIRNVIARLEGSAYPEEWVLRGNHHDGWNHGAADPISGMVALLDEARAVALLAKAGERPKRTIVYAAWDAEEPGLIGSTEWVEKHIDQLQKQAVAYINTDGNSRGFASIGGSHTLEPSMRCSVR
ncbi:MAG: M28 family peptidase [Pseudomonadales bacterium]